ncbi:hypothetical protein N3K66_004076 [Trichothecium roseum]|uniref:Uncharacterized protein n=1 Tax=Trichothecium roseum TaxID=47278 RepID=A0ACC0V791_9HYPO|nr:hypothetical protein N3K66_004076 [Trichothecium roseum]
MMNDTQVDHIGFAKQQVLDHLQSASYLTLAFYALIFVNLVSQLSPKVPTVEGSKIVGRAFAWEPDLFVRCRYFFNAPGIISSGYQKFKDVPYIIRRHDTDVTVLPIKYLEELGSTAKNKLNSKIHGVGNAMPKWTGIAIMLETYLPNRALTDKLTPQLNHYLSWAVEELDHSWDLEIPQCDDWTKVDVQPAIANLVARMSAKVFVGDAACRDPNWVRISTELTKDIILSAWCLRLFPTWSLYLVQYLVWPLWRVKSQIRESKKIISRVIADHHKARANGEEPEGTILDWMLDNGTAKETDPDAMTRIQCFLTSASIHTTSSNMASSLFELCTHPEWIEVLREEVQQVIKEHGVPGAQTKEGQGIRQWTAKLEKLDSFVLEVQRLHPTVYINPTRAVLQPLSLKDGTQIPAGASVSWAGYDYVNDPSVTPNPERFDPMRSYNRRYANGGAESHKYTAGQPSKENLVFGFGSQACPGRYFAINEIKLLLARVLLMYDFKWPEGKTNPSNLHINEFCIVNPTAKVMMKRRQL